MTHSRSIVVITLDDLIESCLYSEVFLHAADKKVYEHILNYNDILRSKHDLD